MFGFSTPVVDINLLTPYDLNSESHGFTIAQASIFLIQVIGLGIMVAICLVSFCFNFCLLDYWIFLHFFLPQDCQPYLPCQGARQEVIRSDSFNLKSHQPEKSWKPLSGLCESIQFVKLDSTFARAVLIDVQGLLFISGH